MFQVSLSTLLTPPMAPGAGLPAALSGGFSAALAELAAAPDGTDIGKSALGTRQAAADAGKSLPTEAGESIVLPASADDWLDPVAILASSNAPPTAVQSDAADPIVTPKADQAPKRDKPATLPIANGLQPAADPIIIGNAILSLRSNDDKPATDRAAPTRPAEARKKTDVAAPAIDPGAIVMVAPIAVPQTLDQAAGASKDSGVSGTSTRLTSMPIAAMLAPLSPPSDVDAPSTTLSSDLATPSATPAAAASEHDGDTGAPAVASATIVPAMTAAADGVTVLVATPAEAAPLPESRRTESIVTMPKTPARSQDEAGARSAATAKITHRGDIRIATGSTPASPVAPGPAVSSRAMIGRASLQPPATQVSGDAGKLPSAATAGSAPSSGDVAPPPVSTPARSPDAIDHDKATQPTTIDAAPPASSRVATVNAAPAANATAATPPPIAAPLPAGMLFGIALDQRIAPADRPSPRDEALQALSALAGAGSAAPVMMAAGGAQHGTLDMRREDWPQAMIDRIDALRDAADATSTRITLMPDALGKVDVSLRHDGDTVHVHFAADAAQTRTMLADAQPRLADAAQARGIKLGQTSVGAGGGEAGHQPPRQPAAPMPSRPVSARPTSADAASDSSRLA